MLSACKAIVIGRTAAQVRRLKSVAARAGFGIVEDPAIAVLPVPRASISYVLVHHKVGDELLSSVVRAIRSGNKDMCFSPIIVVADRLTLETTLHFVDLGVDDIITLAEKRDVLIERFSSHLWLERFYVETESYLGPDRRHAGAGAAGDERRSGYAGHARYMIRRIPEYGTTVVRHQIFSTLHGPQTILKVG